MTKQELIEEIEFALSQLADCRREVSRIENTKLEPDIGDIYGTGVAKTLGRAEGMATNARIHLDSAVNTLRICLGVRTEPIRGRLTRSNLPALAEPSTGTTALTNGPGLSAREAYKRGRDLIYGKKAGF